MKFPQGIPVQQIAHFAKAKLIGNDQLTVTGANEIHKVTAGDISFVDHPKYYQKMLDSAATVILIDKQVDCPVGKALLVCAEPFEVYDQLVKKFRPRRPLSAAISDSAVIHPSAILEPNVVIGNNVHIGEYAYIQANTYIGDYTRIGDHVHIEPGCQIGTSAFYFKKRADTYQQWTTGGEVIIEDHVQIGAGSTIARGVSGQTIIGSGTKLDAQCHVAHGVVIGKHCLLVAGVAIAGKTIIGDHTTIYGQAGIAQSLVIGSHVTIGAQSGVTKDIPDGSHVVGSPAAPIRDKFREMAAVRQLPEWMKRKG